MPIALVAYVRIAITIHDIYIGVGRFRILGGGGGAMGGPNSQQAHDIEMTSM